MPLLLRLQRSVLCVSAALKPKPSPAKPALLGVERSLTGRRWGAPEDSRNSPAI